MGDFDITSKHLIAGGPRDWLTLAGLPVPASADAVRAVDAELSTLSAASDQVIRVDDPIAPYLAVVDFQSGHDAAFDLRMLLYNVLARWRHRLPVRTVAYLLRPAAETRHLSGGLRERLDVDARLEFDYRVIRVWELSPDLVLAGGLGTLPLAPVTAVGRADLPGVIDHMRARLDREVPPATAGELWYATRVLLGLRYDAAVANALLKGVLAMRESTTYMETLEEGARLGEARGEARGLVLGTRRLLLRQAVRRLGPVTVAAAARLETVDDLAVLERLDDTLSTATDWASWLDAAGVTP